MKRHSIRGEVLNARAQKNRVVLKRQELSYGIEAVFREHLPKLKHGNDGLIFTSAEAPYTMGTDPKMSTSLDTVHML